MITYATARRPSSPHSMSWTASSSVDACKNTPIRSSSASSTPSNETSRRKADPRHLDNYATHKHPKVRAWLARNPRWTFHFTQPQAHGSTPWRTSSQPSQDDASGAASSNRSSTFRPPSIDISSSTTTIPSPSSGPNQPRTSRQSGTNPCTLRLISALVDKIRQMSPPEWRKSALSGGIDGFRLSDFYPLVVKIKRKIPSGMAEICPGPPILGV